MAKKIKQKQLERRARQAQQERQRLLVYVGIGVLAALLIIGFVVFQLLPSQSATAGTNTKSASAGVCSNVESVADEGRNHLVAGQTPVYTGNPPSSGTHNPIPLDAGIYDKPVDVTMQVHSEEHGYIIINYNGVSQDVVQQLTNIVQSDPRKVILAPYPNMPYKISLTAWDHQQTCTGVNAQAITSFIAEFRDHGPENVQ